MSSRNKYLEMLKAMKADEAGQKHPITEPSRPSKPSFEGFEGAVTNRFSPPLDADGVPCGGCPTCGQGEFWRWPRSHPKHDPNGWVCWFCSPPPPYSGPCDFCGVPDHMLST